MIRRVEIPPEVARRFFKDLGAFHGKKIPSRPVRLPLANYKPFVNIREQEKRNFA